ncbi:Holliday junction resolvase RuvX [Taibaiella lutea]|uniref:Putative pre-16S rRNA nuclease n=1 Tax=Taibaiella lutea TaxID=2608001 RepID=A0A5M6CQT0_9BACT|nr:Holliday junction resolvase RuvX [Taibaiella lutea]KAA5536302.1 Holliday junction resolvase RuvX [Taibaiella lutea]
MARILAIDYGRKRTGIAVTDPLKMIASGLTTIDTEKLIWFLKDYFSKEAVELILLGDPKRLDGTDNDITPKVDKLFGQLQKLFPNIPSQKVDERFTSKMAFQTMIDSGLKKKDRQNKALIDEISATILLQGYLDFNA